MLTFKASISSVIIESIYSKLPTDNVFTFSKRRIFFNESQLDTLKIHLGSCRLLHQTEYTLKTVYDKDDQLQYQITIGQNCTGILYLTFINRLKLKFVHDLIKLPKWIKKIIDKLFDKGLDAIIVAAIAFISYKVGINNGQQATKSDQPTATQQHDTTTSLKEGVRNDTRNVYSNIDTSHSVPYSKDSSQQKDTTH